LKKFFLIKSGVFYWFPNPFWPPQSGHCHVMPLQDIPQKFSSMQSWQIANPHLHLQQKGAALLQQLQLLSLAFSRFCLYADLCAEVVIFCCYIAVHPLLLRSGSLSNASCR